MIQVPRPFQKNFSRLLFYFFTDMLLNNPHLVGGGRGGKKTCRKMRNAVNEVLVEVVELEPRLSLNTREHH